MKGGNKEDKEKQKLLKEIEKIKARIAKGKEEYDKVMEDWNSSRIQALLQELKDAVQSLRQE